MWCYVVLIIIMKRFLVNKSTTTPTISVAQNILSETRGETVTKQLESDEANEVVFDISNNIDEQPVQPRINIFPRRMIYNKYRSFNSSWYLKYPWIEYSKQKDRIYCYYCRHFAINISSTSGHNVFNTLGYWDWKRITDGTLKHQNSMIHKLSLEKYKAYKSSKTTGAVSCQVNSYTQQQVIKNREVLTSLIRMVLYCARQDISLRGHRNEKLQISDGSHSQSSSIADTKEIEQFGNQGN